MVHFTFSMKEKPVYQIMVLFYILDGGKASIFNNGSILYFAMKEFSKYLIMVHFTFSMKEKPVY